MHAASPRARASGEVRRPRNVGWKPATGWRASIPPNLWWATGLLGASRIGRLLGASGSDHGFSWLLTPAGMAVIWGLGLLLLSRRPLCGLLLLIGLLQAARVVPPPALDRDLLVGDGVPVTVRIDSCTRWNQGAYSRRSTCRLRTLGRGTQVQRISERVLVAIPLEVTEPPSCARVRGRMRIPLQARNRVDGSSPASGSQLSLHVKSQRLVQAESCGRWLDGWNRAAARVRRVWDRAAPTPGADPERDSLGLGLARAMWTGDRDLVAPEVQAGFANWGLMHLLAASGLHVGVVLGLGALALGVFPWGATRWLAPVWMVAGATFLLLSVGPRPSIVRALCMTLGVGVSILTRRPSRSLSHLALALAILSVFRPEVTGDLGAVLSFSATAGVLVLAPRFVQAWRVVPQVFALALAATVAAQLSTAPWSHRIDPMIPLGAPVANLIATPMAAWTLAYGGVAWALAAFGSDFPVGLAHVFEGPIEGWVATVTGPPIPWLQPLWWGGSIGLFFWCTAMSLALLAPRRGCWLGLVLLASLFRPASGATSISFLDVGQGDAALLRSEGRASLVDGGGWRGGDIARIVHLPVLARSRIRKLDAVVLSHGDADHCLGLRDLARRFPIHELWLGREMRRTSKRPEPSRCERELLGIFEGRVRRLRSGEGRVLGRWELEVLLDGSDGASDNDRSVVLAVRSKDVEVLLTGDIERASERRLAEELGARGTLEPSRTRVLKVAHHGSKSSTTMALLDAFQPHHAVISAGRRNVYGHPSGPVLERLEARGARVLRTDRDGRVDLVLSDRGRPVLCFNTADRPAAALEQSGDDELHRHRGRLVPAASTHPCDSGPDGDG